MDGRNEWSCHKILFQTGLSATETLALVEKAYGSEALNRANVFRRYSRFGDGRELLEDDEVGERWPSKFDLN
jgi:hypothetical protein